MFSSFASFVAVVDTDDCAGEGERFAVSDEDGAVNLPLRRQHQPDCQQCAPEGAHRKCNPDLDFGFHELLVF